MKTSTRSLILLAAAATLAAGIAWRLTSDRSDPAQAAQPVCPALVGAKPVRLDVTPPSGATWSVVREGGRWTLPGLADIPAQEDPLARLMRALSASTLDEPKTALVENHRKLSLVEPVPGAQDAGTRIKITAEGGKVVADLIVGKRASDGGFFVRRTGENQTWLSRGLPTIPAGALDFANRELSSFASGRFKVAVLTPVLAIPIRIEAPPAPSADGKPAPYPWKEDAARRLLDALAYAVFDDVKKTRPEGQPVLLRLEPANPEDCAVEVQLWPATGERAWVHLQAIPPRPPPPAIALPEALPPAPPAPLPGVAEAARLNEQWRDLYYSVAGNLGFAVSQNHATLEAPPVVPAAPASTKE